MKGPPRGQEHREEACSEHPAASTEGSKSSSRSLRKARVLDATSHKEGIHRYPLGSDPSIGVCITASLTPWPRTGHRSGFSCGFSVTRNRSGQQREDHHVLSRRSGSTSPRRSTPFDPSRIRAIARCPSQEMRCFGLSLVGPGVERLFVAWWIVGDPMECDDQRQLLCSTAQTILQSRTDTTRNR